MIIDGGMVLKQGTGYLRLFHLVASSDHLTPLINAAAIVVKLSKAGATGVTASNAATQVDSTNLPGLYQILLSTTDTSTLGDLGVHVTATSADPTVWVDHIQSQLVTDIVLDGTGRVSATSNVRQNTTFTLPFTMTSVTTGAPLSGLTGFTCQRSSGSGFSACANTPTEIGGGDYALVLVPTDTNSAVILVRITQALCNDLNIVLYTSP